MQYILTKQDKALIYLNNILKLSSKKVANIIETLEDVSVIFSSSYDLSILRKFLTADEFNEIRHVDIELVNNFVSKYEKEKVEIFTILSDIYPDNLKEISNPPFVLFAKGNLDLLQNKANLSVVGTRRCTNYGQEVTKAFTRVIAKSGVCIISGLADGIDTLAHLGALEVEGSTIAVIGSGFNNIYPSTNIPLFKRIVENNGLVITEYELDEKPQAFHFPARNRIVAGLSLGVLIIEAPLRSGALITKEYALECNREIFVVPGRITDIYSRGSNEVIKNCQGTMVLTPDDILEYFGKMKCKVEKSSEVQLSIEEELVYNIVKVDDKHYEEILISSKMSPFQLNAILMKLEIKNLIKKLPGNIYTSIKI